MFTNAVQREEDRIAEDTIFNPFSKGKLDQQRKLRRGIAATSWIQSSPGGLDVFTGQ
jgi:hypothetical protein